MSESPTVRASFGRVAYHGYREFADGRSLVSGAPLPTWDEQSDEIKSAWDAAADEVVQQYEHFRSLLRGESS